jgi:hypothetical protein
MLFSREPILCGSEERPHRLGISSIESGDITRQGMITQNGGHKVGLRSVGEEKERPNSGS